LLIFITQFDPDTMKKRISVLALVLRKQWILSLLLFAPVSMQAQSRNATVRQLNSIVDYMDASSKINLLLYWDIKQYAEGYLHSSAPKRNDNYWWTHARPDGRIGPFNEDKGRFPELHVDNEGMISDFEYELYPVLVERENINKLLLSKFFNDKSAIKLALNQFESTMDSLMLLHRRLYEYVSSKSYKTDPEFKTALSIIEETSQILDSYYVRANALYASVETLYKTLPVLKSQQKIIAAKAELDLCKNHINKWADELYNTINNTPENDRVLRQMNDASLSKDSVLFHTTYGYGVRNNGAMPHTRYTTFYGMMKSTLYWYAKDKLYYPSYMTKRDIDYNEFVDRIHQDVEDYNDFMECSDGKQLSENMDYSMKMAAKIGVDTNQNVQLKWPRKSYLFHFVQEERMAKSDTIVEVVKDTVVTEHQQLINNAAPHHMVFLLDVSASMSAPGKLDLLKDGAKYLVKLQRNSDRISLLTFSEHSQTLLNNVPCNEKDAINHQIDKLHTHGSTNADDGIRAAFEIADSNLIASGKNKIILVTDGKFDVDGKTLKLLKRFQLKHVELVILLLCSTENPSLSEELDKLAKKGNGRFYAVNEETLHDVLIKEAVD